MIRLLMLDSETNCLLKQNSKLLKSLKRFDAILLISSGFRIFAKITCQNHKIDPVQLRKYLFVACFAMVGLQSVKAQVGETDALPVRPTAEKMVVRPQEAADMAGKAEAKASASEVSVNASGEAIVKTALQYLGARYRSGHSGPNAFDCSGFTSYVYGKESISISRSSRTQFQEGVPVEDISELQKGDLVFFGGTRSSRRVGHVGIVTEVDPVSNKFKFVHAARTGVKVDDSNSAYYSRRFIGARRILAD